MLKPIKRSDAQPFTPKPVTAYAQPRHTPIVDGSLQNRPVWVPKPWVPARPGAEDHKKFKSLGVRV
jgi:hypothetical protein